VIVRSMLLMAGVAEVASCTVPDLLPVAGVVVGVEATAEVVAVHFSMRVYQKALEVVEPASVVSRALVIVVQQEVVECWVRVNLSRVVVEATVAPAEPEVVMVVATHLSFLPVKQVPVRIFQELCHMNNIYLLLN
jgi:hypothetical protein